jgi:hypothetical protein
MTKIQVEGVGDLDLEWASHKLRRAILRGATTGEILFDLPKKVLSFRMRTSASGRGRRVSREEPLLIEEGKTYFLDQFHV